MPCHCYKWKEAGSNVVIDEGDEDEGHEDERSETGKEGDQREEDGGDERSETRKEGDQREEETNRKMGGRHDSWGRDNYEDHEGAAAHDRWTCRGRELTWVREHRAPISALFCPGEVPRGPANVNDLWSIRKTEGVMKDGRKFAITDEWKVEGTNQASELRQPWTGRTTFTMRTPSNRLKKMQTYQDSGNDQVTLS